MIKAKKEKAASKKEVKPKVKKAAPKSVKAKVASKPATSIHKAATKTITPLKHKTIKLKEQAPVLEQIVKPIIPPVVKPESKKIEPQPKPKIEPRVEIKHPPKPEVKHHPKVEPKVEVKVTPKPEHKVAPKIEPKPEPKVEVKVEVKLEPKIDLKELELQLPITVKDLAIKLQDKPSNLIKTLMGMGVMIGINQVLDEAVAVKICEKYGCQIKKAPTQEELALSIHEEADDPKKMQHRAPIVTIMGHVDHGKTSLLDAIRKTKVAESEHGGITQHIGAYRVTLPHGEITFLDTPGHEAFTAMRARGASVTDIVILVVAADDGLMPQTEEAIDHARAAGVPIIVAINKMDKPGANIDLVKKQLQKFDLVAEDWGGKTIMVPVSAKTGEGIDNLLEMMLLEAQMLELRANPQRLAKGVVIEAKMSKGRGPVVTLLVKNGTLHLNENIIVGNLYGKIRAMFNDRAHSVTSVGPSVPVEVLGISGIPQAGEQFFAIQDEKQAKDLARIRMEQEKQQQVKTVKRVNLEELHAQISEGKIKELKMIIKADVHGSLEAITDTLNKLNVSEIKLDVIHTGVGNINNSDVILAQASNALVLGFNVIADDLSKETAAKEGIDVRIYNIIYELANDIKAAVEGMLEPKLKKVFLGRAEVRKVMKLTKAGIVAGSYITKGKINRSAQVSVVRNGEVVYEGKLASLKRFKDDVRDVQEGFECGLAVAGFDQILEGDIIEAYEIEKIARKL